MADVLVGTWKLNPGKSKYVTAQTIKELTVTVTEVGKDLDVTGKGTLMEGTPVSLHYTVPAAGGPGRIMEAPYDAVSHKRIGPNEGEISYTRGGKVVLTDHGRVSADGKTLASTVRGTDPLGKPVDGVRVYEKQ
jgi:hypothetical protein